MLFTGDTGRITGRTIARIGIVLLLLGLGFLFRFSVQQGWIGELERVAFAGFLSAGIIGAGLRLHARPGFAALLQGGGVAGLYMTAFASHRVYGLVDTTTGFVQLIAVAAVAIWLALRSDFQSLGVVGVAGAFAAPLLIPGRLVVFPGDAGYVSLVLAVGGAIYVMKGWRAVFAATWLSAVAVTAVAVGGEIARFVTGMSPVLGATARTEATVVAAAAWIVLWLAAVVRFHTHPSDSVVAEIASVVVPISSFAALSLLGPFGDERHVLAMTTIAVVAAVAHLAHWVLVRDVPTARVLAGIDLLVGVAFIAAAATIALDGPLQVLAWAVQGAGLVTVGRRTGDDRLGVVGHLMLGFSAVIGLDEAVMHAAATGPDIGGAGFVTLAVIGILGFVAAMHVGGDERDDLVAAVYGLTAHVAMLAWTWWQLSGFGNGQGWVTVAWGVYGVTLLAVPLARPVLRTTGVATLLLAVAKLFIVDLAAVSGLWKILLFIGFGLGLLVVGYVLSGSDEDVPGAGEDDASGASDDAGPLVGTSDTGG